MKTEDIEKKLIRTNDFDKNMIKENAPTEFSILLNKYLDEKEQTKAEVIRKLNINRNYGYLIFNGNRIPTRNCIIQMGLILKLDIDEINNMLKSAEKPPLYVRNVVDAKVFYAVKHDMEYLEAVDFIWKETIV